MSSKRATVPSICQHCGASFYAGIYTAGKYCGPACVSRARLIPPLPPLAQRFWARVVKGPTPSDCWAWSGATNATGYGQLGRCSLAHRVSWTLHYGAIPARLYVLHRCDNPPCTNPSHILLGTAADNSVDMARKRRGVARLTSAQVVEIRVRYNGGRASQYQLAKEYGVDHTNISMIVNRKSWAWL